MLNRHGVVVDDVGQLVGHALGCSREGCLLSIQRSCLGGASSKQLRNLNFVKPFQKPYSISVSFCPQKCICSLIECEHLKWLREITSNQGLNLFSDVLPSSVSTLVSIKRWGLYNVHLQCTGMVYVGKEVTGIWEGDGSSNRKENNYKIPIRKKVMVKKYFFFPQDNLNKVSRWLGDWAEFWTCQVSSFMLSHVFIWKELCVAM